VATSACYVLDQVLGGLDADGQSHEVSRRCEGRGRGRRVRHLRRDFDQALDPAEALGQQPEPVRPTTCARGFLLGLGEEGDHPAEVAHLPGGDLVP
jgi:hypothetical protein